MKLKPINNSLEKVSLEQIENHKKISISELKRDLSNLKKFPATSNENCFFGNPFLYHFQFQNLLKCKRQDGQTIYDIHQDSEKWNELLENTRKRNRGGRTAAGNIYECFRINSGSVVMFKSTTAKYLYRKYGAKSVLDPTAGWGGRMLGAWSLGIDYVGIDTNIEMKPAYSQMMDFLFDYDAEHRNVFFQESRLEMMWKSCLEVDFTQIPYDFVLTSPPYVNLELYEHMEKWESNTAFHKNFLIPLWDKCMSGIKQGGFVCLNISPRMYEDALSLGLSKCDEEENLRQQLGQQTGKKKQDKIYIWRKS
jgi:hypothetical protein